MWFIAFRLFSEFINAIYFEYYFLFCIIISNSNNSNNDNSNSNNSYSNISNVSNSIENNVHVDSSVCENLFNFLLGGSSINNSTREWKDLFKCQMKSGTYSDTPFLVITAALLQSITPSAIDQHWSLFNRFKSNRTTNYQEHQC